MNPASVNLNRVIAIGAATLMLPSAGLAQADTSNWKCELCPFEEGYRASYDAGISQVSDDELRFGNGSGYDEEGSYLNLGGEGHYAADGVQMKWYAEDLGLDSRVAEISGGRQGRYELQLSYSELPYRLFDSTRTVFGSGTADSLLLPANWVRAPQTSGFTQLASSLSRRNIESDRQHLQFGANYLPTSKFGLFADYRRQQRDGIDIVTGSAFTQASYLPRPIDYYTDEVDLGARYMGTAFDLTLAYYGSFFRNDTQSLIWDNPFTSLPGAEQGRMAQEPDNDFQQLSLAGSYRAGTLDTVVAFSAALGRGEQDQALLPYTINPDLSGTPLPRSSLDGKVDTSNFALTVTSRPFPRSRVKLAYRQDERDNQTPQSLWSRIITDSFTSGSPESNVPYSFERRRLKLSANYKLWQTFALAAGYDRTELDRDFQEVAEQTEDAGWGSVRWRPNAVFDLTARGGTAKRDIDRYDTTVAVNLGQNPLLRKYNLAYRFREFGEVTLAASLPQHPLSLGVSFLTADDSYTQSQLGLTDSEETRVTADLSWAVSEHSSIYVTAGTENIEARQTGSELAGAADWFASHDDDFRHVGGGFHVNGLSDKVDLRLDYTRTDGETQIAVAGNATLTSQFPDLESTLDSLRLELRYQWSERLDTTLDVRYERFENTDWALDNVMPDTVPTVLTLGASAYDYDIWVVGVSFSYRYGSALSLKQ